MNTNNKAKTCRVIVIISSQPSHQSACRRKWTRGLPSDFLLFLPATIQRCQAKSIEPVVVSLTVHAQFIERGKCRNCSSLNVMESCVCTWKYLHDIPRIHTNIQRKTLSIYRLIDNLNMDRCIHKQIYIHRERGERECVCMCVSERGIMF